MTTDLRDGLHELAERGATAVPPSDLWRRGVRRRRRIRAAAAGVAVAALTLGVLGTAVGWDVLRTTAPGPAESDGSGAIPDRLHTPSPWLDGTQGQPPGVLAVIAGAERRTGWRGELGNGWVGVSAATGEYRFLDLPGAVELEDDWFEADPVLSPDGRAVAYWLAHPEDARWVGGWAVYDTVSGDVARHRVGSRLGLSPETLGWSGNGTVLLEYSVVTQRGRDGYGGTGRPMVLWAPETGEVVEPEGDDPMPVESVWPTARGVAVVDGKEVVLRDDVTGDTELRVDARTGRDVNAGAVDAGGTMLALLPQASDLSVRRLFVGRIPASPDQGDVIPTERVSVDFDVHELVGWRDADHVLVRGALPPPARRFAAIYAVDVRTGTHELVVHETRDNWIGEPDYADELWARPTVRRPGPDRAYDPRVIAGAGGLLAAGLALLVWRRRARR